jgi:hypothetical protein
MIKSNISHPPPAVQAAVVMQGLVDANRMGCSSLAAHSADIHQSKDIFATVNLSLLHFTHDIKP